jgi:hypothetical protein
MKIYEAWYLRASYVQGIGEGFTWSAGFEFQNRKPLENTTDFSFVKDEKKEFTPNYPQELISENFKPHQAFAVNLGLTWQPGAKYIELPDQKINIGSKWPAMTLGYTRTFDEIVGSDVNYSRWRFALTDVVRFKLAGVFNYRVGIGGFIHNEKVQVPDYQHFNGNISRIAQEYLNTFQLLPIYEFSNISKFYFLAHIEHHFNGFLTNKIPGFRNLNWYLVSGISTFSYEKYDYLEYFIGLENIFKNFRFDYYWARKDGKKFDNTFRVGFSRRFGLGRRNDD